MRAFFAKTIAFLQRAKAALFGISRLRGIALVYFVIIVSFGIFAIVGPSFAQPSSGSLTGDVADWLVSGVTEIMLVIARLAIGLTIFFLHFFITLASYNNYINTPVVQVGWIMVRDVANMFFVVALLVIAFGTILGLEQYEWKKSLVKLILGAIFINFSNLLAQLIIDVAHVFTITFLNAIAAAAGGNLIQMFHLTEILSFIQKPDSSDISNVRLELLGGAMMSVLFAVFAAVAMGAYVIAMMARVVLLWVLIIMSPLAFIWQVLPATQGYAERWWKEFREQVLVAPIMVFFLWLTFATLGTGTVIRDIQDGQGGKSTVIPLQSEASDEIAVSISKVSSWERMASFLVAIAFLFIGIKEVGETGAVGSRIIGNAVDFGKKVATVATGVAAARWIGGGAATVAKAPFKGAAGLAKLAGWHVVGKHVVHKAKTVAAASKDWYYKQGNKKTEEGYRLEKEAAEKKKQIVEKMQQAEKETDPGEKAKLQEEAKGLEGQVQEIEKKMEKEYSGNKWYNVISSSARRGIQFEKQLAKTEKQMEHSRKLLWKSVGSEAGGKVVAGVGIGTGTRGVGFVPLQDKIEDSLSYLGKTRSQKIAGLEDKIKKGKEAGEDTSDLEAKKKHLEGLRAQSGEGGAVLRGAKWLAGKASKGVRFFRIMGDQFEHDEDLAKLVYEGGVNARDRVERGWLKAEEARSAAKDEEFEGLGELQGMYRPRIKYDVKSGKYASQASKGGMADQVAKHKVAAELHQEALKAINGQARLKIVADFDAKMKKEGDLQTRKTELTDQLAAANTLTDSTLERELEALKVKMGGIDYETEQTQKEMEEAIEKSGTFDPRIKELDEKMAQLKKEDKTDSDEYKKAEQDKAKLEAEKIANAESIQSGKRRLDELAREKQDLAGSEDRPGLISLLEAELKDVVGAIEGGDEALKAKLGEIDKDIEKKRADVKDADSVLDGIPERREEAETKLQEVQTDPDREKRVSTLKEQIADYEKQLASPRTDRITKDSLERMLRGTPTSKGLYKQVEEEESAQTILEAELAKIQQEEEAAKQKKDAAEKEVEKLMRPKTALDEYAAAKAKLEEETDPEKKKKLEERVQEVKENVVRNYRSEIDGQRERLQGSDDEKIKEKYAAAQAALERVRKAPDEAKKAEVIDAIRKERAAPIAAALEKTKKEYADLAKKNMSSGYGAMLHQKSAAGFINHILEQDEDRLFHALEQKELRAGLELDDAAKEFERGKFSKKGAELEKERKILQAQVDEKRAKGKLGTLDQQRLELQQQRKAEQAKLDALQHPLEAINAEIKRLEEIEKAQDKALKADSGNTDLEEKLQKTRDDKAAAQKKWDEGQTEEAKKERQDIRDVLKERDDQIIKVNSEIKAEEDDMKKRDPAYARLQRQLREKEKEIKELQSTDWKTKANRLRAGDKQVAEEAIGAINAQIEAAKLAKDAAEVSRLEKEKEKWHQLEHHIKEASLAWRYGTSAAKKEFITKGYKYSHNLMLSESEQREIYDERGLDTPKTTLTELIEQYGKSFGEMSIESFVANVGPMLTAMIKKKRAGTLSEQDKAAMMGLFKRGLDRSWLDDAIYAIRDHAEAKEMIADELGWKDNEYTDDKIRDIQMLFATGDVDFVKKNAVFSYMQDVGQNDFGIEQANIFEGIRTGSFKDKVGKDITAEFKEKVQNLMNDPSNRFSMTDDQKALFEQIFASTLKVDQKKLSEMQRARSEALNEYLEQTRKNQSEFQFLGNLRPEALKSGHTENAGYALTRDIGGGETLYMGMGVRSARRHVMGDARKMDLRNRAGMQSHSFAYLDENNGQVLTYVHEDKYADLMNGIDPRTYNAVNPRARVHMMGLSSSDKFGQYRDSNDNSFYVSKMLHADGTMTNAAKTWQSQLSQDGQFKEQWAKAKSQKEQEKLMAAAQMNRIFAPQMRGNVSAFVMLAAEAAGMNPTNAAMDGGINFKIFNPAANGGAGGEKRYTNIQELINDYNAGNWSMGGAIPLKRIPNFVPTDKEGREASKKILMDEQ